jgi:hypothetical protein
MKPTHRVTVLGAGAAGLMSTLFLQQQKGISLTVLERKAKCGRKIIMSGGSRCNVLPHESKWPTEDLTNRYFSTRPDILKQILQTWSIEEQVDYFKNTLDIPLSLEEESGKYFPTSNDAHDVLNAFLKRISHQTQLLTSVDVQDIQKEGQEFVIRYNSSELIKCDKVVFACGGISVINNDSAGYLILKRLGHTIVPLYAALTPMLSTTGNKALHKELAGVSADSVIVSVFIQGKHVYTSDPNALLFTHRGYSGPAILNSSHALLNDRVVPKECSSVADLINNYKDYSQTHLLINWTPNISRSQWEMKFKFSKSSQTVEKFIHKNSTPNFLPTRLLTLIFHENPLKDLIVNKLSESQRKEVIDTLLAYKIDIGGDAGLKHAEVTGGGVSLSDIDPNTLESKVCPGLYITGEALDAFGCIGGFNFALAWITGRLAATSITNSLSNGK